VTLTPAELRVLLLVAKGRSRTEVARDLGLSLHTVSHELSTAYAKLGATTAIEAFIALGWLHLPAADAIPTASPRALSASGNLPRLVQP
jgi:DNA-binding CsgD family transcriptional regulator